VLGRRGQVSRNSACDGAAFGFVPMLRACLKHWRPAWKLGRRASGSESCGATFGRASSRAPGAVAKKCHSGDQEVLAGRVHALPSLEPRENAFGGAGATRTNRQTSTTTQSIGSGGFGFRYELASKFGMHARIDVAHSPGTTTLYFVVGNAWFRP